MKNVCRRTTVMTLSVLLTLLLFALLGAKNVQAAGGWGLDWENGVYGNYIALGSTVSFNLEKPAGAEDEIMEALLEILPFL